MTRSHALNILASAKPELTRRYGVAKLALFGSTARDAATAGSDVDILVMFSAPATAAGFFGVKFYLEELFGGPVDLVTENAVRPELHSFIMEESVYV